MKPRRLHQVLLGSVLLTSIAFAQDTTGTVVPDERVTKALATAKIGYAIEAGDFCSTTRSTKPARSAYGSRRKHRVLVLSSFVTCGQWRPAARACSPSCAATPERERAHGAGRLAGKPKGEDEYLVVFASPLNANADADTLKEVIEAVTLSADRIEKQLSEADAF